MKAESKDYPLTTQRKQGGFLVNYDVLKIEREGEEFYQYESVFVHKLTKDNLVPAMIRTKYSANDEYKMARISKATTEWKEYDAYVKSCIAKAEEILALINKN